MHKMKSTIKPTSETGLTMPQVGLQLLTLSEPLHSQDHEIHNHAPAWSNTRVNPLTPNDKTHCFIFSLS